MLYKFKSKVTGDLIMLEPQGQQILRLIGKEASAKGIILSREMPAAIRALEAAVVQEERAHQAAQAAANASSSEEEDAQNGHDAGGIRLKQRVVPFIDMLRRAHAEDQEIVWGV